MADFSANSKKLIALEVVDSLSIRYLDALQLDEPNSPSSTSKPKSSSIVNLPVILEPFPQAGPALWKLPSWQHIKWTSHALAPVFSLPLDSINSISNAVKIYCLWLKNPLSRPTGVNDSNLEEFISVIFIANIIVNINLM